MMLATLTSQLATFERTSYPFVSAYLDGRPDQHGRERYRDFAQRELTARLEAWPDRPSERDSLRRDIEKITAWLRDEARPSANGIAIFACSGAAEFFQAIQLDVPLEGADGHAVFVAATPRLLPLVRTASRYRPYAAAVVDSRSARIFVFDMGPREPAVAIEGDRLSRTEVGGWSQARYQRHVDNLTAQHAKEVVEALGGLHAETLGRIVLAGDEEAMRLVREEMPKSLADLLADPVRLEVAADDATVFRHTLVAAQAADARDDAGKVMRALDANGAGGLGAAGLDDTRAALANGQVHELFLSATLAPEVAERLVIQAQQTSTLVTFIDQPEVLDVAGGVAARLRYRIGGKAA